MLQQEVVAGGRDNPAGRGEWSEPRSMLFPRHHPSPSTPHHRLPDPTSEHSPPLGPHGPHLFTQEGREAKTGMCVCPGDSAWDGQARVCGRTSPGQAREVV